MSYSHSYLLLWEENMCEVVSKYQELFTELEKYEEKGVPIMMEGEKASPMQVITAHMVREDMAYMRDYEFETDGSVKEVYFNHVNKID